MSDERTNCIDEQRSPASEGGGEGGNDSSPSKHSRRVSWSLIEAEDIISSDHDTAAATTKKQCNASNDPSDGVCSLSPESSGTTLAKEPSITMETISTTTTAIEKVRIKSESEKCETPLMSVTAHNTPPQNTTTTTQDSYTKRRETQNQYMPPTKLASRSVVPVDAAQNDDPAVIQKDLQRRVSVLQQGILALQKIDSVQRGQAIVREYELRSKLEGLCEDIVFLGDKEERLNRTLLKLQAKKAELDGVLGDEPSEREGGSLVSNLNNQ